VRRAVCPGSFDPVTNGHLDIVRRAANLFDEVIVAVGVNKSKHRLFAPEERLAMLEQATADLPNVSVAGFTGLLTVFCEERGAQAWSRWSSPTGVPAGSSARTPRRWASPRPT
jgi:pantetheine-phosphate adenylyltransferase